MINVDMFSRKRIDPICQAEVSECGLACISMISQYYGLRIDLSSLRKRFPSSLRGISLRSIIDIFSHLGFSSKPLSLPLEGMSGLSFPVIIHWDMNHFVVVEKHRKGKFLIHDPSGLSAWRTLEYVSEHFTGVALEVFPSARFEPGKQENRLNLNQLKGHIVGISSPLAQVIMLTLLMQLFAFAMPYYMQISVDKILPTSDFDLLHVLVIGFLILSVINVISSFLRSFITLKAGSVVGLNIAAGTVNKLLRLPIDWFEKRHTGDIISRLQSIPPIQKLFTEGAVIALIDGVTSIGLLFVMLYYSIKLAVLAIVALGLYLAIRFVLFSPEKNAREAAIVAHAKEQSLLIESIQGITTLRLFGKEGRRHNIWYQRFSSAINSDIHTARISIWQENSGTLIFGFENIISLWIAISLIMKSDGFSIGMIFAFFAYKGQFHSKSVSFIEQAVAFKMLRLHLDRISDIALSDEDRSFSDDINSDLELHGSVEVKGVFFRYSNSEPLILKDINIKVDAGEHVAITGKSGGGKSTLVKILLGILDCNEGSISIDGIPLRTFGIRNYQRQVSAVLQDDNLFAGSIRSNIGLFDDSIEESQLIECAKAASIHDDIMNMPMRYDTLVGDMGSSLSGGQKQRVLLARALYRKPKILIMDEGTSHLDADNERAVNAAISSLGITRIIIAHRQETIESADRIITIDDGQVIN